MAFAVAATIALLSMVFGCGVIIKIMPFGSTLLEETLTLMGSTKDQLEMAPKGALVCHSKDHLPP